MSKKLRCTKNLIKAQKEATTACWKKAMDTMVRKLRKIAKESNKKVSISEIEIMTRTSHKDETDQIYRKNLCELPTETIEAILLAYDKGRFTRATITIQVLRTELANRILLGDSSNKKESKSETK